MRKIALIVWVVLTFSSTIVFADSLWPTDVVKRVIQLAQDNKLADAGSAINLRVVAKNSKNFETSAEVFDCLKSLQACSQTVKQLDEPEQWNDGTIVRVAIGDSNQTIFYLVGKEMGYGFLWSVTQISKLN